MTTLEEIEAAVERWSVKAYWECEQDIVQCECDVRLLADAFLAERAERQRRIEAAADNIKDGIFGNCRCGECTLRRDFIRDIIKRHLDGE